MPRKAQSSGRSRRSFLRGWFDEQPLYLTKPRGIRLLVAADESSRGRPRLGFNLHRGLGSPRQLDEDEVRSEALWPSGFTSMDFVVTPSRATIEYWIPLTG